MVVEDGDDCLKELISTCGVATFTRGRGIWVQAILYGPECWHREVIWIFEWQDCFEGDLDPMVSIDLIDQRKIIEEQLPDESGYEQDFVRVRLSEPPLDIIESLKEQ